MTPRCVWWISREWRCAHTQSATTCCCQQQQQHNTQLPSTSTTNTASILWMNPNSNWNCVIWCVFVCMYSIYNEYSYKPLVWTVAHFLGSNLFACEIQREQARTHKSRQSKSIVGIARKMNGFILKCALKWGINHLTVRERKREMDMKQKSQKHHQ